MLQCGGDENDPIMIIRGVLMNLAEQVYQTVKPLPDALAQEVLDFALFLRQREEALEWQNLMLAQADSLTDWNNTEDEVWNDVPAI
jgi:hypothetical protein